MRLPFLSAAILAVLGMASFTQTTTASAQSTDALFIEFQQNGALGDVTDGMQVMDIQQLRSHPCYNAVGAERDTCRERYGVEDFTLYVDDTMFMQAIRDAMIERQCTGLTGSTLEECAADAESGGVFILLPRMTDLTDDPNVTTDPSEAIDPERLLLPEGDNAETDAPVMSERPEEAFRVRAERLWDVCAQSDHEQAMCYQSNLRSIKDAEVPFSEIEKVIMEGESVMTPVPPEENATRTDRPSRRALEQQQEEDALNQDDETTQEEEPSDDEDAASTDDDEEVMEGALYDVPDTVANRGLAQSYWNDCEPSADGQEACYERLWNEQYPQYELNRDALYELITQ